MRTWIYPDLVDILKEKCKLYLSREISVKDIQKKIYEIEREIVSLDEKWFRQILFELENKIELYMYTVDSKNLNLFVTPLIESLLNVIQVYEQTKVPIEVLIKKTTANLNYNGTNLSVRSSNNNHFVRQGNQEKR